MKYILTVIGVLLGTAAFAQNPVTVVNTPAVTCSLCATAAKQPALGTAGASSTDVISVQGIASGTALPVSGTVTANMGTGTATVAGGKTNNNAAPGATNVGVLGYLANAAAPTNTEGNLVAGSVDLHGSTRSTLLDATGAAITPSTQATQDGALTVATTTGGMSFCRASAAAPTGVSADDDAVMPWCLRSGAGVVNLSAAGALIGATNSQLDTDLKSGAVASGAIASGAVASGAFASGSIASGAIASGAIASGAVASGAYGSDSGSFGVGSTGAAPPAKAVFSSGIGSGATGGFLVGIPVADGFQTVSVTTGTTTLLITGVSGRHVRISSLNLVTAIANNVALISGTGATCGTGTTGIAGGTTAANGWNFAANGGITLGSGVGTVIRTTSTGDSVCVITSAAGPLAGAIAYTIY